MKSYFLTELKYQFKQIWKRWSKLLAQGFIGLAISISAVMLWGTSVGQRLDYWMLEQFFTFRGPTKPPENVLLVALDDETYVKLDLSSRLPFPRSYFAEALEQIVESEPKAIIIDARLQKERQDLAAEDRIEAALRAGPTSIWNGQVPKGNMKLLSSEPDNLFFNQPSDEKFRNAAKMELPMLVRPDAGLIARISLAHEPDADLYKRVPISRPLVELAKMEIISPGPRDLINYYGEAGTFPRMLVYELFGDSAKTSREKMKDKIIVFGYQSIGRGRGQMDKDELFVPLKSKQMFGVEIHANIVGNLVDRSWIRRSSVIQETYFLYLVGLLFAVIGVILTPGKTIAFITSLSTLLVIASYISMNFYKFWIPGVASLLVIGFCIILGSSLCHYVIIKSFKRYIQKTFKFNIENEI